MGVTKILIGVALLGLIPIVAVPGPATFWGVALTLLVLVAVDVALAVPPTAIALNAATPASVRLGETATATLTVRNTSSRTWRGSVRYAWQPSAAAARIRPRVELPAGASQTLLWHLTPLRRGPRTSAHVTLRADGPLRLAFRQKTFRTTQTIHALHPFGSRKHLGSRVARLRELDGQTTVQTRGSGTEFDSLKEYVRGDDIRSVDWRATARSQTLAVRTWRPERDRRVVLVVDTSRTAAVRIADQPKLEFSIDAALLMGSLAARAGDRVEMIAVDTSVHQEVRCTNPVTATQDLLRTTSPLEPALVDMNWQALLGRLSRGVQHRSLIVLFTSVEGLALESDMIDVIQVLARRHFVLVASVKDPRVDELAAQRDSIDDVYRAAAAEQTRAQDAAVGQLIVAAGAELVMASASELAPKLADSYLALKSAGRL